MMEFLLDLLFGPELTLEEVKAYEHAIDYMNFHT